MQPSFVARALALWIAGTVAGALVLPHAWEIQAPMMREDVLDGIPPWMFLLASFVQTSMFVGLAAAIGIMACDGAGLKTPVLDGWLGGDRVRVMGWLPMALGLGVAAGALTAGLDAALTPAVLHPPSPTALALLAIPHGAVVHEVLLRLMLTSLVAVALRRAGQTPAVVAGIAVSILVFGGYQVLAVAKTLPLTPALATQTILLKGIVGATCGVVYWKRGIVPAMVAHAAAELVVRLAWQGSPGQ